MSESIGFYSASFNITADRHQTDLPEIFLLKQISACSKRGIAGLSASRVKMMTTMQQWVASNVGSSGWLLLVPLLAAYAPRGLPQMYFNLHLWQHVRRLLPFLDPFVTIDIISKSDSSYGQIKSSDACEEVKAYLSATCSRDSRELFAEGTVEGNSFLLSLREGQEVADVFHGVTVWWSPVPRQDLTALARGYCLRLTFHQRHRELIVNEYLPHVRQSGRDIMFSNQRRRLYTNKRNLEYVSPRDHVWSYIDFENPTTFDTLAMHPTKKRRIMGDLDNFRNNKDYYRRIGKAWKRGYLLYGPPGTGKSSMIAAMANYLNYDIYDIELTTVHSNSDLRKLFIETTGKSIIVIEDIDCSLDLTGQRSAHTGRLPLHVDAAGKMSERTSMVTLSGLLNFIDGIWSAHSGERIIVFTTNFLDKLDPALIRRGRMDVHIEMPYCGFKAFTTLAKNYLGVDTHPLFDSVKELLQAVEITPADVAECLLTSQVDVAEGVMMSQCTDRGADACLGFLIDELKKKAAEKEKAKYKTENVSDMAKEEIGKDTAASVRPIGGEQLMANGDTVSGMRASGNSGDLSPSGDSINNNEAEADAKANGMEAMAVDGAGRTALGVETVVALEI